MTDGTLPDTEERPDWYQVVYNLAAQHAHRAVQRAAPPHLLSRLRDVLDGEDDDAARAEAKARDVELGIKHARSAIIAALATVPVLNRRLRQSSDKTSSPTADVVQFLETTVEPTAAMLLAGLYTRPGLGDTRDAEIDTALPSFDLAEDETREREKARADLLRKLRDDRLSRQEVAESLLSYAARTPNRNYRVDYNLACFMAGRLKAQPDLGDEALQYLRRSLDIAPPSDRIALADWAQRDPSLRPLEDARSDEWSRLIAQYRLPIESTRQDG